MVEGRYRRGHVVGQTSRGGCTKRFNHAPYQRFPPPPHAKIFYPPNPNIVAFNYPQMPGFVQAEIPRNMHCIPPFPLRPPPFLPPIECLPPLPQYTQPPPPPPPMPIAPPAPTQPRFQLQYDEFEKMKRRGMIRSTETECSEHKLLDESLASPGDKNDDTFTSAMKNFMQSYLPTANFNSTKNTNDWSKEAVNLLEEISAPNNKQPNSIWNIPKEDKSAIKRNQDVAKSLKDSITYQLDVLRHIQDIKPSPYPGGSPISMKSRSNPNSDNDADDETTPATSPAVSRGSLHPGSQAVGARRTRKKLLSPYYRQSQVVDSGYQSSSTESSSGVIGKPKPLKFHGTFDDVASESGFTSTGSSRRSSPRACNSRNISSSDGMPQFLPNPMPPVNPHMPPNMPPIAFYPGMPMNMSQPPPIPSLLVREMNHLGRTSEISPGCESPAPANGDNDTGVYYKHKAWITDEILGMIAVRDRLYRRMKKHPAPDIVDMYKKIRNMVVGMTRNAKRAYEKKIEDQQMLQRQMQSETMAPTFLMPSLPHSVFTHANRSFLQ